MELTARQLNRSTLQRQLLLERAPLDVVPAIRHLVGLQAQYAASPYLALWNRLTGFDPATLDAAFASGEVLKASLLRITLHAVAATDHPALHAVMTPTLRASRLYDRRFTRTGLTAADADGALADLRAFLDVPRSNAEMEAFVADRFPELGESGVWWALRTYAPLVHAPAAHHPWSFGPRPAYRAAPTAPFDGDRAAAMAELARRYLRAYGPASAADLALFSTLARAPATAAFGALGEELVQHRGPDGKVLYDLADATLADPDTPAPARLLGMWDNALLAHVDRSRLIPPEHRGQVIRRNGDVLPMVLVDGTVAGVWRPVEDGIEVTAFTAWDGAVWEQVAAEADAVRELVAERDPLVFGRYGHWWSTIEGGQVTVL